ncbi:MAG: hypothetical protein M1814_004982 [Vezdaea aestivalis]|nr:MAG: hypothetical protein M1814_004982 [Vezdaea aestivalis]
MVAHRRKNLPAARRRVEDEGEDEGTLDVIDAENDSLSEGSVITDDEDDADGSGLSVDGTTPSKPGSDTHSKTNGHLKAPARPGSEGPDAVHQTPSGTDTDLMRNGTVDAMQGLKLSETNQVKDAEGVDFENMKEDAVSAPPVEPQSLSLTKQDNPLDRRRREHEDYKKKRDEDPAFVPNRGAFFMHDHRHAGPAANGFRPFGRGRGGRPQVGGPFSPAKYVSLNPLRFAGADRSQSSIRTQAVEAADAPWSHDMHEPLQVHPIPKLPIASISAFQGPQKAHSSPAPQNRSFSKTTHIANVPVRVLLEGMQEPKIFSQVAVKHHTRLPQHRPPLRRDKPVRISLPQYPPRYIYPNLDRSFIFIPRAMRPNQHGPNRGRGRGYHGAGGYSSRRTSVYGGSIYSGSVSMSRRSSLAHEISRDAIVSPTGSTMSRTALAAEAGKPIVRLPPVFAPPIVNLPQPHLYPNPEDPAQRENPVHLTMHQPKPQKAVSISDIETPANLQFHPPQQQQQQPFHHQVPAPANSSQMGPDGAYPHVRNASYPSQESTGTPLSHIPERAIHAQPFQPPNFQPYYPQMYSPMSGPPQGYYYAAVPPPHAPVYGPVVGGPQHFPPQATPYVMAADGSGAAVASASPQQATGPSGTIAQESNGMVYYYDSSQVYNPPSAPPPPPPPPGAAYPMGQPGGVVGMGGMMTPSPDGYYYPQSQPPQGTVFYG